MIMMIITLIIGLHINRTLLHQVALLTDFVSLLLYELVVLYFAITSGKVFIMCAISKSE